MPLTLSRKPGQHIQIGDNIWVTVVSVQGDKCRLGITAPREVAVLRDDAIVTQPKAGGADREGVTG